MELYKILTIWVCTFLVPVSAGRESCEHAGTTLTCQDLDGNFLLGEDSTDIVHIYIVKSNASKISSDDFSAFSKLELLFISNSSLFLMKEDYFEKLQRLSSLTMRMCEGSDEVFMLFRANKGIRTLVLAENKIAAIKKDYLQNLQLLEEIDLGHNQISLVEPGVFHNLRSLKSINLRENKISEITKEMFGELQSLEKIDLSFNQIVNVETDVFQELASLKTLDLSANRIGETFKSAYLNMFPRQCTVCRPQGGLDTCITEDLSYCSDSHSIDDLFRRFPAHNLILENNPICNKMGETLRNTNNSSRIVKNTDISSDVCRVYFEGACFLHESRRYFLAAACNATDLLYNINTTSSNYVPSSTYKIESGITENGVNTSTERTHASMDSSSKNLPEPEVPTSQKENFNDAKEQRGFEVRVKIDWNMMTYIILGCCIGLFVGITLPYASKYIISYGANRTKPDQRNKNTSTAGDNAEMPEERRTLLTRRNSNKSSHVNSSVINMGNSSSETAVPRHHNTSGTVGESVSYVNGNVNLSSDSTGIISSTITSLREAVSKGDLTTLKSLFNRGRDIHYKDDQGNTFLHIASQQGHIQTVKFLLNEGADFLVLNKWGDSPLKLAIREHHMKTVKLFLVLYSRNGAVHQNREGLLHAAAEFGKIDIVRLLLHYDFDPNATNNNEDTPLHLAARQGHTKVVEHLLTKGNPDVTNRDGITPVHLAAMEGHMKTLQLLLENDGKAVAKNKEGDTPLHLAAWNDRRKTLLLLLDNVKVDVLNNQGRTALMGASRKGHLETVELLLKRRADPKVVDQEGNTAVMCAAEQGHAEVVKTLLKSGAQINVVNNIGDSPLHVAVAGGHVKVVEVLIGSGATCDDANADGKTPRDLAEEQGPDIRKLFSTTSGLNF